MWQVKSIDLSSSSYSELWRINIAKNCVVQFCNDFLKNGDIANLTMQVSIGQNIYDNTVVDGMYGVLKSYCDKQFVMSVMFNGLWLCDLQYIYQSNGDDTLTLDQIKF